MTSYIIRRLLFGVVLIFLATVLSFTILKLSPGEAGAAELDPRLSPEYIEAQKRLFGLDQPPYKQYLTWVGISHLLGKDPAGGLLQGNLGVSISYKQPVIAIIKPKLAATFALNLLTLL